MPAPPSGGSVPNARLLSIAARFMRTAWFSALLLQGAGISQSSERTSKAIRCRVASHLAESLARAPNPFRLRTRAPHSHPTPYPPAIKPRIRLLESARFPPRSKNPHPQRRPSLQAHKPLLFPPPIQKCLPTHPDFTFISNFTLRLSGGIGRHAGLRILFRKECGFDPRLKHQGRSPWTSDAFAS